MEVLLVDNFTRIMELFLFVLAVSSVAVTRSDAEAGKIFQFKRDFSNKFQI